MRFLLLLSTSLASRVVFPQYTLMSKQFSCIKKKNLSAVLPKELGLALNASPHTSFCQPRTQGIFVFTLIFFPSIFLPVVLLTTSRYCTNHQQFRKKTEKHHSRGYCNIREMFGGKNMGKAPVSQGRQSQQSEYFQPRRLFLHLYLHHLVQTSLAVSSKSGFLSIHRAPHGHPQSTFSAMNLEGTRIQGAFNSGCSCLGQPQSTTQMPSLCSRKHTPVLLHFLPPHC